MRPLRPHIARLTISMPVEMAEALRESVESRRFGSVSEVIREALRDWLISATRGRPLQLHNPARPRPRPTSDITESQLADLWSLEWHGLRRFAVRGSARKRHIDCAAEFGRPPRRSKGRVHLRFEEVAYHLGSLWGCGVALIRFEEVDDWDQWTVVYDRDDPDLSDGDLPRAARRPASASGRRSPKAADRA